MTIELVTTFLRIDASADKFSYVEVKIFVSTPLGRQFE
jgi:hypothetical protein